MAKRKRFVQDIALNKPQDVVDFITQDFLKKEGFFFTEYKGEQLWQCGQGLLAAPKFFKYSYINGVMHLEAWMKMAWLPGVYSGEMDFKGFFAAVPKSLYNDKIRTLINLLMQNVADNNQNMQAFNEAAATSNMQQSNGYQQIQTHDTSNSGVIALVCGIVGTIVGLIIPIAGLIAGCFGCVCAKKGLNSKSRGIATAGMIFSIISIVISISAWIFNIINTVAMIR